MNSIDVLVDSLLAAPAGQASISADWTQGRTCYGGLSAAVCVAAMRRELDQHDAEPRPLRNLFVSFVGPLYADQPFDIEVTHLRSGKAIAQLHACIRQQGNVCVNAQGVFGYSLTSPLDVAPFSAPDMVGPADARQTPYIEHITPRFIEQVDVRLAVGDFPGMGSDSMALGGWMRFRHAPEHYNETVLTGLIDAWPPATLQRASGFRNASTVSWDLRFVHPLPVLSGDAFLGYHADIRHSVDGYGYTDACIWAPDGQLLALSTQTVLVF